MSEKTLNRTGSLILQEVIALFLAYYFGHGRLQDFLAWITACQWLIILFSLLIMWVEKHKSSYYKTPTKLSKSGAIRMGLLVLIIVCLIIVWVIVWFPQIVKTSLRHYGVDSIATIQQYQLIGYGRAKAEHKVNSVDSSDALNVSFSYYHRVSTISLPKADLAFDEVYKAAQRGDKVAVRYLPWLPAIVLPQSDLESK